MNSCLIFLLVMLYHNVNCTVNNNDICNLYQSVIHACLEAQVNVIFFIFINIWFAIRRLNKYILYGKRLFKGMQATQSVKWNEMYKWKDSDQGTADSTLDHLATTPRAIPYNAPHLQPSNIPGGINYLFFFYYYFFFSPLVSLLYFDFRNVR